MKCLNQRRKKAKLAVDNKAKLWVLNVGGILPASGVELPNNTILSYGKYIKIPSVGLKELIPKKRANRKKLLFVIYGADLPIVKTKEETQVEDPDSKRLQQIVVEQLTRSLQEKLALTPELSDEELMEYSKKIFPSPVTKIIAESRDR